MDVYAEINGFSIRRITKEDDLFMAEIVRSNLKSHGLDVPGTAYFDPELDQLSIHYSLKPKERAYFIAQDSDGRVAGGVGFGKFAGFEGCAEIQKLYVRDDIKRNGVGTALMGVAEKQAEEAGYAMLYLETHTNLVEAITLYEKTGYVQIPKPEDVFHDTMNRFYIKKL